MHITATCWIGACVVYITRGCVTRSLRAPDVCEPERARPSPSAKLYTYGQSNLIGRVFELVALWRGSNTAAKRDHGRLGSMAARIPASAWICGFQTSNSCKTLLARAC